jgi:hypothetical protein
MAFTDYKNINTLKEKHPQLVVILDSFIPDDLTNVPLAESLKDEIQLSLLTYRSNEFFASEGFVSPILRQAWRKYFRQMNMWTHQAIKYDDDLSGVPDYMFTHLDRGQYEFLSYPIVTSVEAKAENFVEGWAQCSAQMLACQKLNKKENVTVFGIVTTGKTWEFAKMEGDIITKEPTSYGIDNLQKLMNVLSYILAEAAMQLQK